MIEAARKNGWIDAHFWSAVAALNRAMQLRAKWFNAPAVTIFVEIEGNFDAFANPAIEAGLVHCRALLEFLGRYDKNSVLSNIERRRRGDVGIEHFKNAARSQDAEQRS